MQKNIKISWLELRREGVQYGQILSVFGFYVLLCPSLSKEAGQQVSSEIIEYVICNPEAFWNIMVKNGFLQAYTQETKLEHLTIAFLTYIPYACAYLPNKFWEIFWKQRKAITSNIIRSTHILQQKFWPRWPLQFARTKNINFVYLKLATDRTLEFQASSYRCEAFSI